MVCTRISVNMELIPSRGEYDRLFVGLRARVAEEIAADDMRVDVDLGASEAEEVPLSHVSARAVEAVRLLMINSHLTTRVHTVSRTQ